MEGIMPVLAAAYVDEVSQGRIPAPESLEAVAYHRWSARKDLVWNIVKESAIKVYGNQYYLLGSMV